MNYQLLMICSLSLACTLNNQGLNFVADGAVATTPDTLSNTTLEIDTSTLAPPDVIADVIMALVDTASLKTDSFPTKDLFIEKRSEDLKSDSSPTPDIQTGPDLNPISSTDLRPDSNRDLYGVPDLSPDLATSQSDLSEPDSISDSLIADSSPDRLVYRFPDTSPDLTVPDLASPDLAPTLPSGSPCTHNKECDSTFCTDGVCCDVAKCVNTCIPNGITACAPYNGFTCAPYGTCRGF